ncbi:proteasome accessory factor PafA2 [Calidifontibacter sp. DB0510]|uniref:Proteasome accessory factor PafA2 n=1 Tax=Metallococcus carri TaxID=1656884 RepID=A0A967AXI8_9MICO|nr:depupylase/deamidase Dop [Metallococcus carri]NHN54816.1 proteasome accessory factor PafA2 [Metallococcus carri]NOP37161.1 proteasome accessory factor PafA2 [Calidifontibacter sp. DB2511S]
MTVRRVMGIETEYGISQPGDPTANPMLMSGRVVTAYARDLGLRAAQAGWDYEDEAPLRDARGWDISRALADPSQLTDEEDPTLANVVLSNGARLYVDHAHPEYSSPEVTSPRAALTWDRAGELVMREAVRLLNGPGMPPLNLYKNNTDGKGASYGTHENYLMPRETPFARIVTHLIPFFVSRQVVTGSGKVGIGTESTTPGFQLSQRADFFEVEVGLETTLKRPIINTRDEPHAVTDKYRRLHVIIGDANHCDVAGLLKMGTTSLVLSLIEADAIDKAVVLDQPVAALQAISHDPTLRTTVKLVDGRSITGLELQWHYYELAANWVTSRYGGDVDADTTEVLQRWESVLTRLGQDPMSCAREIDWVAKLQTMEGFRSRGLEWSDPKLRAIDIQWSDVRADKGIFHKLAAAGRFEQLVPEAEVERAVKEPPEDTRAYFRGKCLERFTANIAAASWDSVIFDVPERRTLQRVPMREPLRGTKAHVGDLFEQASSADELLQALRPDND